MPVNKKSFFIYRALFTALLITAVPSIAADLHSSNKEKKPTLKLAIIIDDLGYNKTQGMRAASISAALTLAVLPQSPNGKLIAEQAHSNNKEIMLHLPMESEGFKGLDTGGLDTSLSKEDFISTVQKDIASVPYMQGINNHMGSLLTQQTLQMGWLMEEISPLNFYFVDSKTHPKSVARKMAQQAGIPNQQRHVFLDNEKEVHNINKQFNEALRLARKKGYAIIIGHPHKETMDYLEKVTPLLVHSNIEIVPVSALIPQYRFAGHTTNPNPNPATPKTNPAAAQTKIVVSDEKTAAITYENSFQ